MSDEKQTLEARIEQLTQQVEALNRRVGFIYTYLRVSDPEAMEAARSRRPMAPADEELITWAGRASLLPRIATLCFLLVAALILRTVTDHKLIDTQLGSIIGMSYAVLLMLFGWHKYSRSSHLAPIFAVCGAVLLCSIVVETHERFRSLPTVPAYGLLMATGVGMAAMAHRFRAPSPILAGTFVMCLAGAAIDYPDPFFLYPAMILLIANVLGYMAAGFQRCAWLRWIILLVTLLMLTLWSFKLGASLGRGEEPGASLASGWFFPVLSVFAIFLPAISLLGILRRGEERVSSFNAMLPTIGGLWAFGASYHMLSAWGRSTLALGIAGTAFAAVHFGVAQWLAMRRLQGAPGTNAFAFAGSALLGLGLFIAFETPFLTLPVLSGVALGLAVMANIWESGGVRLTSYLIQICVSVALALFLGRGEKASFSVGEACAAGLLALFGSLHYRWCRQRGPHRESSVVFSRYDKEDYGAALCLIAALISAFSLLSGGMYKGITLVQAVERNSFACAQTVLINLGATGLMIYGYLRNSKEIRNVAILVTAVGAFRVFLHDLLYASGIPLVLSVFSFGLAALLESMALGRWQRRSGAGEGPASLEAARSPGGSPM